VTALIHLPPSPPPLERSPVLTPGADTGAEHELITEQTTELSHQSFSCVNNVIQMPNYVTLIYGLLGNFAVSNTFNTRSNEKEPIGR